MKSKRMIASAVGLALSLPAGTALAQGTSQQPATNQPPAATQQADRTGAGHKFQQADRNRDGYLTMDEARTAALPELGPQEFQRADSNRDGQLSESEFVAIAQGTGEQQQAQARESVPDDARTINVQQQPAQIDVQQQPPKVIVRQNPPDVVVQQPQPDVQITQPEPKVRVEQAQPRVQIQGGGQPQVEVRKGGQPDVEVVESDPETRQGRREQEEQAPQGQELTQDARVRTGGIWDMKAGDLEGTQVINSQGEELGEVQHVVRDANGRLHVIVSMGGFLGIGASEVPVAVNDLSIQDDQLLLSTDRTAEQLKQQASDENVAWFQELDADQRLADYTGGRSGTGARQEQLSFRQLDRDGDGYVSEAEASASERLSDRWSQADENSDGQLDYSEFSAFEEKTRQ